MARVERIGALIGALRRLGDKVRGRTSVLVGYTQNYALPVHERLDVFHPVGQAKYLEQPARTLAPELAEIARRAYQKGATVEEALLLAGLRLQRASQQLVPVDTGALRNSAFTRAEGS